MWQANIALTDWIGWISLSERKNKKDEQFLQGNLAKSAIF